jgi:hypothetical protein
LAVWPGGAWPDGQQDSIQPEKQLLLFFCAEVKINLNLFLPLRKKRRKKQKNAFLF